MPESLNYPVDQRHALTTDDRCVLLAEAVKYYAGHIQETILNNWDDLCEAIDAESARKKLGQVVVEDRSDLSLFIQKLADARVWVDKLAKLPFALGAVSPFSHIVESFWTTVHRGLKSALRELAPRPTEISASLRKQLSIIVAEHTSLGEVASLVIQSGGYAHCQFPPHVQRFIEKYAPLLAPNATDAEEEAGLSLNDASLANIFVDKGGIAALFAWFGHRIGVNSVKDYILPDRSKRTTSFPASEAHEAKGQHQQLYRLSLVIEWLKENKSQLKLVDRDNLPKTGIHFYSENDGAKLGIPPRKPK